MFCLSLDKLSLGLSQLSIIKFFIQISEMPLEFTHDGPMAHHEKMEGAIMAHHK